MYCTMPTVASGSRRAAAAKHSSGIAVNGPDNSSQPTSGLMPCSSAPLRLKVHHSSAGSTSGASSRFSIARPSSAPSGAVLRMRP